MPKAGLLHGQIAARTQPKSPAPPARRRSRPRPRPAASPRPVRRGPPARRGPRGPRPRARRSPRRLPSAAAARAVTTSRQHQRARRRAEQVGTRTAEAPCLVTAAPIPMARRASARRTQPQPPHGDHAHQHGVQKHHHRTPAAAPFVRGAEGRDGPVLRPSGVRSIPPRPRRSPATRRDRSPGEKLRQPIAAAAAAARTRRPASGHPSPHCHALWSVFSRHALRESRGRRFRKMAPSHACLPVSTRTVGMIAIALQPCLLG